MMKKNKFITVIALTLFAVLALLATPAAAVEQAGAATSVDRDVISEALEIIGDGDTISSEQLDSLHSLGLSDDDVEMLLTVSSLSSDRKTPTRTALLIIAAVLILAVLVFILIVRKKLANPSS